MDLDLVADPVALLRAFTGRPAVVGVVGVLAVLVVAGWRPGSGGGQVGSGRLPRHVLAVPVLVAVLAGGGDVRLRALSGGAVVALVVAVGAVAWAAGRAEALVETSMAAPLLLLTALGLFACLPETGGAITLAWGTATLLAVAPRHQPTGLAVSASVVGVALVVASDGIRPGQVVGGAACLGMLAAVALASVDRPFGARLRRSVSGGRGAALLLLGHAAVVVSVARGPGIRTTIEWRGHAAPLALALLTLTSLALLDLLAPHDHPRPAKTPAP